MIYNKRRNYILLIFMWLCFCMVSFACSENSFVVINEICSSNGASYYNELLGNPDWIELRNLSKKDIDLKGYILTDKFDSFDPDTVLPSIVIPSEGYVVIPAGEKTNENAFSLPFGLSKKGETIYLLNPSGKVLHSVSVPQLSEDVSYSRREDGAFGYCYAPTPEKENQEIRNEKTDADEHYSLMITEVSATEPQFVELFNLGEEDVSIDGMYLSNNPGKLRKAIIQDIIVPSKGYAVIHCGKNGSDASFQIGSNGETIFFSDSMGHIVDSVELPLLFDGQTWAKNQDGVFGYCGIPTPGNKNEYDIGEKALIDAKNPGIMLNEVLFHNSYSIIDSYGDRSDYVELFNAGDTPVDLSDYYLSDDFDNPTKCRIGSILLNPGEYRIVFLSGHDNSGKELHMPFSVGEHDDGIMLYEAKTRSCQMIPYVQGVPDNVAMGLDNQGRVVYYVYPTPGFVNATAELNVAHVYSYPQDSLYISEISSGGINGEWIELRNGSTDAVDLTGWRVSDSVTREGDFLPEKILQAGAYLTLDPLSFHISSNGDKVFLWDQEGNLRDWLQSGVLMNGTTCGRTGSEERLARVFYQEATKGTENSNQYFVGRTVEPIINDSFLYKQDPFFLEVTNTDKSATLYYTLDGSAPGVNSQEYSGPIYIDHSCTVNVVAISDRELPSRVVTANYLFTEGHSLPVITISVDPGNWERLSKQNFKNKNSALIAQVGYYVEGKLETMFPSEINTRGNSSITYPQKSLSLHLRSSLGQSSVTYPFWNEEPGEKYFSFVLRNASQDHNVARIRDSFANRAAAGLNVISIKTRPVIVYVNGIYYGILDFEECLNQDYFTTHYGVTGDKVNIIQCNDTVRTGSPEELTKLRKYARQNDFTKDKILQAFSEKFDVDATIDYLIVQTFFGENDVENNLYASAGDGKIKWQPVLYDEDRCFTARQKDINMFEWYFSKNGVTYSIHQFYVNMDVFSSLRENKGWSTQFVERYAELLCTDLSEERLHGLVDIMAAELRPEMPQHIERWKRPTNMGMWEHYIVSMKEIISFRYELIQEQIKGEFKISPEEWDMLMRKYTIQ